MNILLVDDDNYILESIKSMINWEKIGIEEIYSADCVQQAKEIVEKINIRIILCDIEMNDATGLEFIDWVRKGGGKEQVIFLTSYAEFSYAKKAVSLNSLDYLLKPIEFPVLEERLCIAVQKAKEQEQSEGYIVKHNLWMKSEPMRKEMFFRAIFEENNLVDRENLEDYKQKFGMEYAEKNQFVYLCIEIFDYMTIYEKVEAGMFCFLISNITGELFSREGFEPETIFRSDTEDASQWNVILRMVHGHSLSGMKEIMENVCHNYIRQIKKTMQSKVGCYVGNIASVNELKREMEQVKRMKSEDVTGINKVRFLCDYKERDISCAENNFLGEEEQSAAKIVKQYMSEHLEDELNRETFAKLVYLNPDYLAKLFKKAEGVSMGQYLNDIRMDRAKILLGTTQRPINQVAVEVGFINFSYFAKMFRNRYGMTPNEFRKQSRR